MSRAEGGEVRAEGEALKALLVMLRTLILSPDEALMTRSMKLSDLTADTVSGLLG